MAKFEKTVEFKENQKNDLVLISISLDEALPFSSMRVLEGHVLFPIGRIKNEPLGSCANLENKTLKISTTIGRARDIDKAKIVYEFKIGDKTTVFKNPIDLEDDITDFPSEFKFEKTL